MKLKWGHLCTEAVFEPDRAVWHLMQIVEILRPRPGQKLIYLPSPSCLALYFEAHSSEPAEQQFRLVLRDHKGGRHSPPSDIVVEFMSIDEGHPMVGAMVVPLIGNPWQVSANIGHFFFEITSDKTRLGRIPLYIIPTQ